MAQLPMKRGDLRAKNAIKPLPNKAVCQDTSMSTQVGNNFLHMGSFINHVDMARGGVFPNIHITTKAFYYKGEVGNNFVI